MVTAMNKGAIGPVEEMQISIAPRLRSIFNLGLIFLRAFE